MRQETILQAKAEVEVLDALSDILRRKIEDKYGELNQGRRALPPDNIEEAAAIHNVRRGLLQAFEEIARRGYGRVVFATEVDESGRRIRDVVFRLSQANAALGESPIFMLSRNSVNGSRLASCRVDDSIEFKIPGKPGERYLDVTAIIDLEGLTQLLGDTPDAALARFRLNAVSNAPYRGVNILALWAEATARGYASPLWAGYKQWQSLGTQVRQGERGTLIVFYQRVNQTDEEREGDPSPRYISRTYWVFNACQVDNFAPPLAPARTPVEIHDDVEAFIRATEARIYRDPNKAYYWPATDGIYMPDHTVFLGSSTRNATEAYYAVLLHELTHWTGARHRLSRDFGLRFGDKAYAFEELIAELGAAFMCSAFGITNEPRPDHAAYVASWLEVLNNDARAIFTAASRAQEAIQFLGELAAAKLDLEPAGLAEAESDMRYGSPQP